MTAEPAQAGTGPRRQRPGQRIARYRIQLAVAGQVLHDRRFQEKVILAVIVVAALTRLGRENQARMLARLIAWDKKHGFEHELGRARQALEPGKR